MNKIPTGTVTFLFTDIQGSTRLWEHHPEAMASDLRRHDAFLRSAIESTSGFVFKTVGDAFCAAFFTPTDALLASLNAQRALASEPWLVPGGVLVRMGVHTGEAEERDRDYFGSTVNRIARLTSAAHGGQVLVSSTVEELVRETLSESMTLVDLGTHRLKDLALPQRIYQLCHPDLRSTFPLINSIDSRLNNLPSQETVLIDRKTEMSECDSLLATDYVRILTLVGTGGAGKTRLAVQVAANSIDRFKNGAFFVDLSSLTDAERVIRQLARVLGVVETTEGESTLLELVKDYFATKELWLSRNPKVAHDTVVACYI